jgi:hypothetical protein
VFHIKIKIPESILLFPREIVLNLWLNGLYESIFNIILYMCCYFYALVYQSLGKKNFICPWN